MGKKRAKTEKNKTKGVAQQSSFKELVAEAAQNAVKPYLNQQIQQLGIALQNQQNETLRALYTRVVTLEKLAQKHFNLTEDQLANLVAETEDAAQGLTSAESIEEGDLVRLEISTKTKEDNEYTGTSRLIVENVGLEPLTLGPEIEPQLIGLKTGDEKVLNFGQDGTMEAKVVVNRVSRAIKQENVDANTNVGE
jgi:bacillopeptidase F (M6 metalloprotease family)